MLHCRPGDGRLLGARCRLRLASNEVHPCSHRLVAFVNGDLRMYEEVRGRGDLERAVHLSAGGWRNLSRDTSFRQGGAPSCQGGQKPRPESRRSIANGRAPMSKLLPVLAESEEPSGLGEISVLPHNGCRLCLTQTTKSFGPAGVAVQLT